MGRKKGGKNKSTLKEEALEIKKDTKVSVNLFSNEKDIKREIRKLKKIKLLCRAGSKERIVLHRQIKDLKNKLVNPTIIDPEKDPIIAEILKIEAEQKITPKFKDLKIDLHKYTLKQLEIHLKKLKGRI